MGTGQTVLFAESAGYTLQIYLLQSLLNMFINIIIIKR
jgi:hypothetical protein